MAEQPKQSAPILVENKEIPPFRALGYLAGTYFYYSRGEQAVVALSAAQHGKLSF